MRLSKNVFVNARNQEVFKVYLNEIRAYKPFSRFEEIELFKKLEGSYDKAVVDKICKHNLLFVVSVAKHYAKIMKGVTISLEDLVNEGNIGLFLAVSKFDYKTGNKFITFAVWFIKQNILNSIQNNVKTIKVPKNVKEEIKVFINKEQQLCQEYGRNVTVIEVFNELKSEGEFKHETLTRLEEKLRINNYEISLNTKSPLDENLTYEDLLVSVDTTQEDSLAHDYNKETTNEILSLLSDEDSDYLIDFFGLNGYEKLSLRQMSEKYLTSVNSVKTKIKKIINNVKNKSKNYNKVKEKQIEVKQSRFSKSVTLWPS